MVKLSLCDLQVTSLCLGNNLCIRINCLHPVPMKFLMYSIFVTLVMKTKLCTMLVKMLNLLEH